MSSFRLTYEMDGSKISYLKGGEWDDHQTMGVSSKTTSYK